VITPDTAYVTTVLSGVRVPLIVYVTFAESPAFSVSVVGLADLSNADHAYDVVVVRVALSTVLSTLIADVHVFVAVAEPPLVATPFTFVTDAVIVSWPGFVPV